MLLQPSAEIFLIGEKLGCPHLQILFPPTWKDSTGESPVGGPGPNASKSLPKTLNICENRQNDMQRPIAIALASLLAAAASATIQYKVHPLTDTKQLAIEVTIPVKSTETYVQLPQWGPGAYILRTNAGANVKDLAAADGTIEADNDHTWRVRGNGKKTVTITYKVPFEFEDGVGHYSGPSSYLYAVGRTQEACTLHLDVPADWKIAIGLDGKGADYKADTYDVLADNPVTMGNYIEDTYKVAGKTHTIALRGPSAKQVDRAQLLKECEFVSAMETDFMGGAPYHKYIWHFSARPGTGGGGLEHLASTEITFGMDLVAGRPGLFAHEFFHLWNVKRIRSKVLGPFDYTQLPKTGALWWLEGVTEYYAQSLLARYAWVPENTWYGTAGGNVLRFRGIPEHSTVSTYDSSYRVGETNNGRGNSNGFGFSYYDAGFVVGLCLDLELIGQTHGKKSLDDVEYALWKECRNNQPGFQESGIRDQLVKIGGINFGALYDQMVMKPSDEPVEAALAYVGLELATHPEARGDLGVTVDPSVEKAGMLVTATKAPELAAALPNGTVIRAVNSRPITGNSAGLLRRSFTTATANLTPGSTVTLKVVLPGSDAETEVATKVLSTTVNVTEIRSMAAPTAEQLRLRAIWLSKHRK